MAEGCIVLGLPGLLCIDINGLQLEILRRTMSLVQQCRPRHQMPHVVLHVSLHDSHILDIPLTNICVMYQHPASTLGGPCCTAPVCLEQARDRASTDRLPLVLKVECPEVLQTHLGGPFEATHRPGEGLALVRGVMALPSAIRGPPPNAAPRTAKSRGNLLVQAPLRKSWVTAWLFGPLLGSLTKWWPDPQTKLPPLVHE